MDELPVKELKNKENYTLLNYKAILILLAISQKLSNKLGQVTTHRCKINLSKRATKRLLYLNWYLSSKTSKGHNATLTLTSTWFKFDIWMFTQMFSIFCICKIFYAK